MALLTPARSEWWAFLFTPYHFLILCVGNISCCKRSGSESGRVDRILWFTSLPLSSGRWDWQRTSLLCIFFYIRWILLVVGRETSTRLLQKLLANDAVRSSTLSSQSGLSKSQTQAKVQHVLHNPHTQLKHLWGLSWSWSIYFSLNSALQSYTLPGSP